MSADHIVSKGLTCWTRSFISQKLGPGVFGKLVSKRDGFETKFLFKLGSHPSNDEVTMPNPIGSDVPPTRVLLVEDDDDLRETLATGLTSYGYSVIAIPAVDKAFDREVLKTINIAVLDFVLEDGNSTPFLHYIKSMPSLRHIKVILMSGNDRAPSTARFWGADHFLAKPIKIAILISTIRQLLNEN